ncbi:MAG: hypothetical protein AAGA97_02480 [Pseudomonadota bacterium]
MRLAGLLTFIAVLDFSTISQADDLQFPIMLDKLIAANSPSKVQSSASELGLALLAYGRDDLVSSQSTEITTAHRFVGFSPSPQRRTCYSVGTAQRCSTWNELGTVSSKPQPRPSSEDPKGEIVAATDSLMAEAAKLPEFETEAFKCLRERRICGISNDFGWLDCDLIMIVCTFGSLIK